MYDSVRASLRDEMQRPIVQRPFGSRPLVAHVSAARVAKKCARMPQVLLQVAEPARGPGAAVRAHVNERSAVDFAERVVTEAVQRQGLLERYA